MTDTEDVVYLLRKLAMDFSADVYKRDEADYIDQLADMVERDYVHRETFEDLRDEFVRMTTFLHRIGKKCGTKDVPSLVAYVEKLEAALNKAVGNWAKADRLVRDMWGEILHCPDYSVPPCMTADISEKMRELDMTNASDEQMAEYERMLAKAMTNKAVKR